MRLRLTRGYIPRFLIFFFFNDTATTEIYTLSLHDALPISSTCTTAARVRSPRQSCGTAAKRGPCETPSSRSEEHTSELQSHLNLVCRLLLEKKKKNDNIYNTLYKPERIAEAVTQKPLVRTH